MLSLSTMTPSKAVGYYSENYYVQADSIKNSKWLGKGAKLLGVSGHVDDNEAWKNLLNGFSADGQQQFRERPPKYRDKKTGELKDREARAGTDFTFSAPKSVSIQALVGGDRRIIEAHLRAVELTMQIVEARYAESRIDKIAQKANNLAIAQFLHDTSRDLDPALHSHCLALNLVMGPDGKWRSGATNKFYQNYSLLGAIYRNHLALELNELGYKLRHRDDFGFELEGISDETIEAFSKRSQKIEAFLDKHNLEDNPENRRHAVLSTRKNKPKELNRDELLNIWREEAQELGAEFPEAETPIKSEHVLSDILQQAINHCQERKSIFSLEDLEEWITENAGVAPLEEIDQAIYDSDLLRKGTTFATVKSLKRELNTIDLSQGGYTPINHTPDISGDELTDSQRSAVEMIVSSSHQVNAWVGRAGAGKTHSLDHLVSLAKQHNIEIVGMAPDASSAETLGQEVNIEARTVAGHLLDNNSDSDDPKLWIVDEAGKLSAEDGYRLLKKAQASNAQVLLVGDPKQLSAVSAGNPFQSLVKTGIQTAYLTDMLRQKSPLLKRAVQLTYYQLGGEAIEFLRDAGNVHESKNLDDRAESISNAYLALSDEERANTLVLAGTHKEREAITFLIREGLKAKKVIADEDHNLFTLRSKGLSIEEKQHTRFYKPGNIVIPFKNHNSLRRSQRYRVTKIDGDNMTLVSDQGTVTLNMAVLKKPLEAEVFLSRQIDIAVGDRLKWLRNDKRRGRYNGREFLVTGIEGDQVSIQYENGSKDVFDIGQSQHLDHAIVGTVYSSQGKTTDRVMVSFGHDPTVNRESVLVALSRAKHYAQIWASNINELIERADISNAQVNPSEVLREQGLKIKVPPPPDHIALNHWIERIEGSGIAPEVAAENVQSIKGRAVQEVLLSYRMESMGSGQLITKPMRRLLDSYEQLTQGGAWNPGGINATKLPAVEQKDSGEFKADNPRVDQQKSESKGKTVYRKYEAPRGMAKGITFPEYPPEFAKKVYQRYGLEITPELMSKHFWVNVFENPEIDLIPVEGKKKAEALATYGYAAIALPSVTGGYRAKDGNDNELPKRVLHPELKVFAVEGRHFMMGFDKDTNQKTIKTVRRDMVRTGELLEEQGCTVDVLHWKPSEGKGIDDVLVKHGPDRLHEIVNHAAPLYLDSEKHYRNEYLKLRGYVMKTHGTGRNPSQQDIDVAVSYFVKAQDRIRVMNECDEVRSLKQNGSEESLTAAKQYIFDICKLTQDLEQRLKDPIQKAKMRI